MNKILKSFQRLRIKMEFFHYNFWKLTEKFLFMYLLNIQGRTKRKYRSKRHKNFKDKSITINEDLTIIEEMITLLPIMFRMPSEDLIKIWIKRNLIIDQ